MKLRHSCRATSFFWVTKARKPRPAKPNTWFYSIAMCSRPGNLSLSPVQPESSTSRIAKMQSRCSAFSAIPKATIAGQKGTFVETVDPQKAFLTIDSGFPLPDLEKVLQEGKPFGYSVPTSRVPLIFTEADWISASRRNKSGENKDLIDTLIHDPILARLYWAMGRV